MVYLNIIFQTLFLFQIVLSLACAALAAPLEDTEDVKAASTNGAPAKPSQAALDFDELTELIK